MVRTRHSGEAKNESFSEFASFTNRRTRRNVDTVQQINGFESDDSGEVVMTNTTTGRQRRACTKAPLIDSESTEDEASHRKKLQSGSPRSSHRSPRQMDSDYEEEEDVSRCHMGAYPKRRGGRPRKSTPLPTLFNGDDDNIRRSTRQRKFVYGTFNQSLIDKHVRLMGGDDENPSDMDQSFSTPEEGRPKRRRIEVEPPPEEEVGLDMYSRVKRNRRKVKRDMYGMPINEESQGEGSESSPDTSEDENKRAGGEKESTDDQNQSSVQGRQYFLREHKPRTNLYEAPPIEPQKSRSRSLFRNESPPRSKHRFRSASYRSPAHKSPMFRRERKATHKKTPAKVKEKKPEHNVRRRAAFHGSSSTSSSSSSESSDDEHRFERRKAKSMARNRNRCLPMNLKNEDLNTSGVLRDRAKIGSSLADVDPMNIDRSVTFESVGGLGKHLRALKEMIVFPLLYPEVFERFKISPPRGVLFYGPPGTGKTLVARALANECSHGERKVAFFMRKGADCLSKWVGESERQLRLLFDQAYQMRPSIIFFDEIDGLAPVRSSRQDQIHSSIVSTLLALMDGLDNRGEIVIIGATNRLDSIDPALRRPGRFDREFLFPLPSVDARKQILQIHTRDWNPKLCKHFLAELAEKCVGYCGADLKALCTEGALHALRRRYPQIYTSEEKLELDVSTIEVNARDFYKAMQTIVPASQRSAGSPARALDSVVRPLLARLLKHTLQVLQRTFPIVVMMSDTLDKPGTDDEKNDAENHDMELYSDEDDDSRPIYESPGRPAHKAHNSLMPSRPFLHFTTNACQKPLTHRPRLLLAGQHGQGQSTHLGPAILHHLERLPAHVLDLPALYAVSAKTPEEACAQIFREARRTSPSILYMPHVAQWWEVTHDTVRATFLALLHDLEPDTPVLLLATAETPHSSLPSQVKHLFSSEEVITMQSPLDRERREFYEDLVLNQTKKAPPTRKQAAARILEILPKAKAPEPRKLTETELKRLHKQEENTLRELRLFLRDTLNKLARDRKFGIFAKPVDTEDVPDYYDIIKQAMDLSTMMSKIDLHQYTTVKAFTDDINLICSNALEYNPDRDPAGRAIRHRACALRDTTNAILEAELDTEFEKLCDEIMESRERRGETPSKTVPDYYYTRPLHPPHMTSLDGSPSNYPMRYSRRARGMDIEGSTPPPPEPSEKNSASPPSTTKTLAQNELTLTEGPKIYSVVKRVRLPRAVARNKSPWCRPNRARFRKVIVYLDECGNEVTPPGGDGDAGSKVSDQKEKKPTEDPEEGDITDTSRAQLHGEEKENHPAPNPNSPNHPASPNSPTPSTASHTRSVSRQGPAVTSPITIHTRSTSPRSSSPRSVSPRGGRLEVSVDPCHRQVAEKLSPAGSTMALDQSPRMMRRRSTRSDVCEDMDATLPLTPSTDTPASACKTTSPQIDPGSPTAPDPPDTPAEEGSDKKPVELEEQVKEEEKETPEIPKVRMTRSRTQVPSAVQVLAKRFLETEASVIVTIDEDELKFLLASAEKCTDGATVEQLERLYSHISQAIYSHRNNPDKTELTQELRTIITSFSLV